MNGIACFIVSITTKIMLHFNYLFWFVSVKQNGSWIVNSDWEFYNNFLSCKLLQWEASNIILTSKKMANCWLDFNLAVHITDTSFLTVLSMQHSLHVMSWKISQCLKLHDTFLCSKFVRHKLCFLKTWFFLRVSMFCSAQINAL